MLQLKLNMEKEGVHMSKRETYEARTEELITPILERMHFELVDVEYVKEGGTWYLRAYIDKEGGITVNDCEAVARESNTIKLLKLICVFPNLVFNRLWRIHFSNRCEQSYEPVIVDILLYGEIRTAFLQWQDKRVHD